MSVLIILIFTFATLQLLNSILNVIFIQKFSKESSTENNELVSILIPARNEEKNLPELLNNLLVQPYQNIEILIFNDQSTDNTEQILKEFAEQHPDKIKYFNSTFLPYGWHGKNYACHQLSTYAKGKYFLFIDADVRINNNLISEAIAFLKQNNLSLLSIFPVQITKTFGEKISVPLMNYILITLLPLIFVKKLKFSSMAAANGQFMLFDAETYRKFMPHEKVKNHIAEDIKIARYLKKNKQKIACVTGKKDITCRMYSNYKEAIEGFAKNINYFFGSSLILSILFFSITTFGVIPMLLTPLKYCVAYVIIVLTTRIFVALACKQSVLTYVVLSPIHQLVLGHIVFKALLNKLNKKIIWKGRNVY